MIHCLKTWPELFQEVLEGRKRFEIRKDDRGFEVGDLLCLQEWNPATCEYTGREIQERVSCITRSAGPVQLLDGLVVLGLEDPQGLGDVRRELGRLGGLLHDVGMALGLAQPFGETEEQAVLDKAVELREQLAAKNRQIDGMARGCDQITARLVAVRDRIQDADGTLMLGSAPQARQHLREAAKDASSGASKTCPPAGFPSPSKICTTFFMVSP